MTIDNHYAHIVVSCYKTTHYIKLLFHNYSDSRLKVVNWKDRAVTSNAVDAFELLILANLFSS